MRYEKIVLEAEKGIRFETAEGTSGELIISHLVFGAEYDSVLEWFIKSKARTYNEIVEDSSNWGNQYLTKNSPRRLVETGNSEMWSTNNIYDFAGNEKEWTQDCCYA